MKVSRRLLFLLPAFLKTKPSNANEKYPWADARYPNRQGNSFGMIFGRCRILLDGEEVQDRCFFYDIMPTTNTGIVGLYKHRDGKPYFDPATRGAAQEWISGKVEVFVA